MPLLMLPDSSESSKSHQSACFVSERFFHTHFAPKQVSYLTCWNHWKRRTVGRVVAGIRQLEAIEIISVSVLPHFILGSSSQQLKSCGSDQIICSPSSLSLSRFGTSTPRGTNTLWANCWIRSKGRWIPSSGSLPLAGSLGKPSDPKVKWMQKWISFLFPTA